MAVDRIRAVLLAAAVFAFEAGPDGIELVHCGFNQSGFICQDACLEVAVAWAFHSQTCAGEICRADVGKLEVKDNQFEVYSGAQNPLQSGKQYWIMVEILPEFRAWFLGMDETDFTPFADQVGKYAQERTLADIADRGRAWRATLQRGAAARRGAPRASLARLPPPSRR